MKRMEDKGSYPIPGDGIKDEYPDILIVKFSYLAYIKRRRHFQAWACSRYDNTTKLSGPWILRPSKTWWEIST